MPFRSAGRHTKCRNSKCSECRTACESLRDSCSLQRTIAHRSRRQNCCMVLASYFPLASYLPRGTLNTSWCLRRYLSTSRHRRRYLNNLSTSWGDGRYVQYLSPSSTAQVVAGCRLVGCSVVSGRPLRSRAVAGVSQRVRVGLGPVLASRALSPPAAAAAALRGRGRVPVAGGSLGGVGPDRGLRGGERRGWCDEWARRG